MLACKLAPSLGLNAMRFSKGANLSTKVLGQSACQYIPLTDKFLEVMAENPFLQAIIPPPKQHGPS